MCGIGMIDIVVYVGIVGVPGSLGHQGFGAARDREELEANVISLRAGFRNRPDRILRKQPLAFDGLIQIALQLGDRQPRWFLTAAFFALIGDAPVVWLVVALECQ